MVARGTRGLYGFRKFPFSLALQRVPSAFKNALSVSYTPKHSLGRVAFNPQKWPLRNLHLTHLRNQLSLFGTPKLYAHKVMKCGQTIL